MKFNKRPDERYEIRLTGTGGQGIITAGMILGEACAIHAGLNTCMTQSYGPEARGGACAAELVISTEEIDAPKAGDVDILLALSQQGYDKFKHRIKKWGIIIVDSSLVKYEAAQNVFPIPFAAIAREKVGFAVTANIVAVGFIAGLTGLAEPSNMETVVARKVPPGTEKVNFKALNLGFKDAAKPISNAGLPLNEYIHKDIVTAKPDDSVFDSVQKMLDKRKGFLFITENGKLDGLFTYFDTVRVVAKGFDLKKTPIKKVMTRKVITCNKSDSLGTVLLLMERNNFKNIPVLDEDGNLEGVIVYFKIQEGVADEIELKDSVDFINASRNLIAGDRWSALKTIATGAARIAPSATVLEVAQKMSKRRVDSIVIVDEDDMPIGIFTERDLNKRVVGRGLDPANTLVEKVMSKRLVTLPNTATITEAFEKMIDKGFHHLPLVNRNGRLRGNVLLSDIGRIIHSRLYMEETLSEDQVPSFDG